MPRLLPDLSVPTGWTRVDSGDVDLLTEDLLQLEHPHTGWIADVGWYPAGEPTGRFLVLIGNPDLTNPLNAGETRDLIELTLLLTDLLRDLPLRIPPTGAA